MLAMGANVMAATPVHPKAPADPCVINHERIIYWMTKRGELPVNATEEQKALALKAYIGKKSFEHAKLPGEFAAKVRAAEFLVPQSELKHKHSLHKASAAIEKAQKKAKEIAEAGNFKVGRLLSIQEGFTPYYPRYSFAESLDAAGGGGAVPPSPTIEPGSQEVKVNVTLVYEIQ